MSTTGALTPRVATIRVRHSFLKGTSVVYSCTKSRPHACVCFMWFAKRSNTISVLHPALFTLVLVRPNDGHTLSRAVFGLKLQLAMSSTLAIDLGPRSTGLFATLEIQCLPTRLVQCFLSGDCDRAFQMLSGDPSRDMLFCCAWALVPDFTCFALRRNFFCLPTQTDSVAQPWLPLCHLRHVPSSRHSTTSVVSVVSPSLILRLSSLHHSRRLVRAGVGALLRRDAVRHAAGASIGG